MERFGLVALCFVISTAAFGADVFGPKPFDQILESSFPNAWTPAAISSIENRKHVLLLDATTKSFSLSIDATTPTDLTVTNVSDLTGATATYGKVMRSMFQMLDLNTAVLADEPLTDTYTLHPELLSYYAIDADAVVGSASATALTVRDRGSFYKSGQAIIAYLVFTMTGTPTSTKIQATSRYKFNAGSDSFEEDLAWSSSQWLVMDATSISLTSVEASATEFFLAEATDLIDIGLAEGSDFNPASTLWQTNSFAVFPAGVWDFDDSPILSAMFLTDVADFYETQFGDSVAAGAAAAQALDAIEIALASQGDSMRYDKSVYLAFRDNMLSHILGAVDIYNAQLDRRTVAHVYFTNAKDDGGDYHPFMVIAAHDATAGPNFLIDVPRPPGDGVTAPMYEDQTITRTAILEGKLVKIPLRDYADMGDEGLISTLTQNDLSVLGNLADDAGVNPADYDVFNYASNASSGIAANGTVVYPASNNTLLFATAAAEINSNGAHVGRGLGLHYHADGHGFNGDGINLYNLSDYVGHSHPPLIAFAYDGIAAFGKHESTHSSMDGFLEDLDEYGGHDHDDYNYHYHAFEKSITQINMMGGTIGPFQQNFFFVGAWRGKINEIPGLIDRPINDVLSTSQLKADDIKRYAGATGTVTAVIPTITSQPQDVMINLGDSTTLSVTATDAITYQWYTGTSGDTTSPIAGETGTSIMVSPTATTSYWVRCASVDGIADSDTATVTVDASACLLDLSNFTVTSVVVHETCLTITAGSNYVVGSGGDLTLRAGESVILESLFSVLTGGVLTIEIDASLLP